MRPSNGIINLANLRTMFGYLFDEIEFTANVKSLSANERSWGIGKFVEKICFHEMLYH